jgi:hypothetical protein
MSVAAVQETSEWLGSFDDRVTEAGALAEVNFQRQICLAGAGVVIKHIKETGSREDPKRIVIPDLSLRRFTHLPGSYEDATLNEDKTVYNEQFATLPMGLSTVLTMGCLAVKRSWWRPAVAKYVYIRELDGSEEDNKVWSSRNDARLPTQAWQPHKDDPRSPVDGTFVYLPWIHDELQEFDDRLVKVAEVLGVELPTWGDLIAASPQR